MLAAYHGHSETVEFLIAQSDADPCQEDNRGNTALMHYYRDRHCNYS
ncbi:hypothetical protein [Alteromonas genovensis]